MSTHILPQAAGYGVVVGPYSSLDSSKSDLPDRHGLVLCSGDGGYLSPTIPIYLAQNQFGGRVQFGFEVGTARIDRCRYRQRLDLGGYITSELGYSLQVRTEWSLVVRLWCHYSK